MFPNSFESRRANESIPKWSYYPTKHQSADSRKSNSNKAPNYGLLLMSIYSKPNYHNSFWQSTIIGSKAPCLFLSQTFSSPIESALGTRNENCFCEQKEEKILCKIQNHGKLLSAYRGSVLYGGLESCGLMGCDIVIEIISHGLKVVLEFFFKISSGYKKFSSKLNKLKKLSLKIPTIILIRIYIKILLWIWTFLKAKFTKVS